MRSLVRVGFLLLSSLAQAKSNHRFYRAELLTEATRVEGILLPAGATVTYASPPWGEAGTWLMVSATSPSDVAVCGVTLKGGTIHFRQKGPGPARSGDLHA
jgi:hypothetical protein